MSTDQSKGSSSSSQEQHPQPVQMVPYPPPHMNGGHYPPPPPGPYPPFFAYGPPPDGSHDPNAPPGPPYIVAYPAPPGMVYYPPAHGFLPPIVPIAPPKPKRKQVRLACTNCAAACKRCDETRPCERCQKYGIAETCVDGVRKERKRGIKRGPYKRKNKMAGGDPEAGYGPGDGQWQQGEGSSVPPAYPPAPEGYYPFYYPPAGYVQPGPDGQPGSEPSNAGQAPPQPHPQYYPVPPPPPPGAYPPYGSYPPPAPPPQQQQQVAQPQGTIDPMNTESRPSDVSGQSNAVEGQSQTKPRKRSKKGEEGGRKKHKSAATVADDQSDGGMGGMDTRQMVAAV
ncbi:hypothetical protein JAAARDRAFT_34133 [Jaapia argillacea MUCL 33604]|uniref:Transcription activator of gluconeogenesis ERT1 n=1 Tax=Jaapia argillacea MUCL 33604 TaxID=933084 RepID=A0A067PUA5_9AGAM|nr:hypothetical protein JAAARDRAFT_34133 [Jaapia argillacea MUCL 33604]